MASNDPFVIDAEVNIQRYGSIEKVKAKLTKEASDLFEKLPEYVFGQQDRKHELFVVYRPEDHYGRHHYKGKVCALVDSRDIPNHARIYIDKPKRNPVTVKEVMQRRSDIGRKIYNREAELEALKAEDRELSEQTAKLAAGTKLEGSPILKVDSEDVEIPKGVPNYATFRTEYFKDGHAALAVINENGWDLVSVRRIYDHHDWLMCITIELPSSLAGHTVEEQLENFRKEFEEACDAFAALYDGLDLHRCWQTLNLGFDPKDPFA